MPSVSRRGVAFRVADFRAIATFATTYPEVLSTSDIDNLKTRFVQFAAEYCEGWDDDDPDWLRQVAGDIEFVREKLEVSVDSFTQPLNDKADEIESERAEGRFEGNDDDDWVSPSSHVGDVDHMFQILRHELEN